LRSRGRAPEPAVDQLHKCVEAGHEWKWNNHVAGRSARERILRLVEHEGGRMNRGAPSITASEGDVSCMEFLTVSMSGVSARDVPFTYKLA
jgi:hypothetical protein